MQAKQHQLLLPQLEGLAVVAAMQLAQQQQQQLLQVRELAVAVAGMQAKQQQQQLQHSHSGMSQQVLQRPHLVLVLLVQQHQYQRQQCAAVVGQCKRQKQLCPHSSSCCRRRHSSSRSSNSSKPPATQVLGMLTKQSRGRALLASPGDQPHQSHKSLSPSSHSSTIQLNRLPLQLLQHRRLGQQQPSHLLSSSSSSRS
jgi:hypothetical protein